VKGATVQVSAEWIARAALQGVDPAFPDAGGILGPPKAWKHLVEVLSV
jgi:hypothetical protein